MTTPPISFTEGQQDARLLKMLHGQWNQSEDGYWPAVDAMEEAAQVIERQSRRIAELERTLAHWKHCHGVTADALAAANAKAAELQRALEELVACKDLKDAALAMNCKARGVPGKVRSSMLASYEQRKPLAWAAARAALATAQPSDDAAIRALTRPPGD